MRPLTGLWVGATVMLAAASLAWLGCGGGVAVPPENNILNVSYDPTREFYGELNEAFAEHWQTETGAGVKVRMSHGGSGKQARSVIDGLEASVVTLALAYDVDAIAQHGDLIAADWQKRLPHNSSPYTSTIVFLVRAGNPKQIKDWGDLVKEDVEVITPNPKTSGGARWNYLAAWGFALRRELGDLAKFSDPSKADEVAAAQAKAKAFVASLFRRVRSLETGARGATMAFVRGSGDVLLAWENEALRACEEFGPEKFAIQTPSISILAEPPVAVVDKVVDKLGTRRTAEAYLQYLYSPAGQQIAARHHYRPCLPEKVDQDLLAQFSKIELFTVEAVFGGWQKAQREHFNDGGVFDEIYRP